jgi:hypothetical protein
VKPDQRARERKIRLTLSTDYPLNIVMGDALRTERVFLGAKRVPAFEVALIVPAQWLYVVPPRVREVGLQPLEPSTIVDYGL